MHNVVNADDAAQYTSHIDVVDKDVRYVLGGNEQFVNYVAGDDVRRARLVRREALEREFFRRQFPLAGAMYAGTHVDRSHDGSLQTLVCQQLEQIRQIDDHVVVCFEQIANIRTVLGGHFETEQRLKRHVMVVVDEIALDDVIVVAVLLLYGVVGGRVSGKTEHEGQPQTGA